MRDIMFLPQEHTCNTHIFELTCNVFLVIRTCTDDGTFDDFSNISNHFPKAVSIFPLTIV